MLLKVFQCVTLEGWSQIMEYTQKSFSFHVWPYFIGIVMIGAFFLMNLTLAVISVKFTETKNSQKEVAVEKDSYNLKKLVKLGIYQKNSERKHNLRKKQTKKINSSKIIKKLSMINKRIINVNQKEEKTIAANLNSKVSIPEKTVDIHQKKK